MHHLKRQLFHNLFATPRRKNTQPPPPLSKPNGLGWDRRRDQGSRGDPQETTYWNSFLEKRGVPDVQKRSLGMVETLGTYYTLAPLILVMKLFSSVTLPIPGGLSWPTPRVAMGCDAVTRVVPKFGYLLSSLLALLARDWCRPGITPPRIHGTMYFGLVI